MNQQHRNKIQSLVSPTDDPGDTPDCITESGPCTWNMATSAINWPIFSKYGFPLQPKFNLAFLVRPEPPKGMPAQNMASSAKTAKIILVGPKKVKKYFFEKVRNFSVLDERGCQAAWGFDHWGPFGRAKGVLGHMGKIHRIFTCIEGKSANFSKYGFSLQPKLNYEKIDPARPLGTSRTPQGHQPYIFR